MDVDTNLESDSLGSTVAHVDRCADYTVIINLLEHLKVYFLFAKPVFNFFSSLLL